MPRMGTRAGIGADDRAFFSDAMVQLERRRAKSPRATIDELTHELRLMTRELCTAVADDEPKHDRAADVAALAALIALARPAPPR